MSATFDHFAYGSNLSVARLTQRCPSAKPIEIGFVRGRQLRFHKIGRDGTGKADAYWTGNPHDVVWGVIYRAKACDRAALDHCESLGVGYEFVAVDVHCRSGVVSTCLYEALPSHIDPNREPAIWYHQHVVAGAMQHSLPLDYQMMIQEFDVRNDESSSLS